jgi:hypothetical protein
MRRNCDVDRRVIARWVRLVCGVLVFWAVLAGLCLLTGVARGQGSAPGPRGEVTISNLQPRRDVEGRIVDAHDGCLHKFGDRYYLYGTAYGKTDGFAKTNRYRCYSSPDLVTWKLEGNLLPRQSEGIYYRPYVIYHAPTRKYVLWYNWYKKTWDGQYGVATSDRPQGPFTVQGEDVSVSRPHPGDFSLLVDDDGAAYLIYSSIAQEHAISIERLADDYLTSTKANSGVLATDCEAPALIKRRGTYYALFDYCCCACPQGSGVRVYTASKPLGPYTLQKGNVNRDANRKTIVRAQQTFVAQIPTADGRMYLWMGDRWGSHPDDGMMGHDLQYWAPLRFNAAGGIEPFKWVDEWSVKLRD